jgi:predicted NBD/HSP70 family sugar kinase
METSTRTRALSVIAAVLFIVTAMVAAYRNIGMPPVVIVGGSSIIGLVLWMKTYLRRPLDPHTILPVFLLTVVALEVHMTEEYLTGFGPAMSRLFDISWTERSFLLIFAFVGPAIYALTALGLFYRVPLAGFMAWFIFIGPGVAEFTHFIFPMLRPAIHPELAGSVSQVVANGRFVADMPNYWLKTTGTYYFSGMYTAILPMIPGIYAIVKVLRTSRAINAPDSGTFRRSIHLNPAGQPGR